MNKEIIDVVSTIYGKKFCRIVVGRNKSLSLGFGEKVFHNNPRLKNRYYGEWEIGTYYSSWRIVNNNQIVLGSNDSDDIEWLNSKINEIEFQEVTAIVNSSAFDVQVVFKNGMRLDFIATFSDEDETFHIFCPEKIFVEFNVKGVWKIGKSDAPWPSGTGD